MRGDRTKDERSKSKSSCCFSLLFSFDADGKLRQPRRRLVKGQGVVYVFLRNYVVDGDE